jgi:hypothetical protein
MASQVMIGAIVAEAHLQTDIVQHDPQPSASRLWIRDDQQGHGSS